MFRKLSMVFCFLTIGLYFINAQEKELIPVQGTNFSSKMRWLSANIQNNNNYLLEVNANEAVSPVALSFDGVNNLEITLKGTGAKPVILMQHPEKMTNCHLMECKKNPLPPEIGNGIFDKNYIRSFL